VIRLAGSLGLPDEERLRLEAAGAPVPADQPGHRLVIGVVGPDGSVLDDPYVSRITSAVAQVSGPGGVGVSLQWLPLHDHRALARLGEDRSVRGLLLVNTTHDTLAALPARLRRRTSSIGWGDLDVASFAVDNEAGFDALIGHLHAAGRRSVVAVAGPRWMGCAGPARAYLRRTVQAGLPVRVVAGGFGMAAGRRAAEEILRRWPDTDAVVAPSDATALGVLAALRQHGVDVPGDVAVTGFDDAPLLAATSALTTATHPADDIARDAARYLLAAPEARPTATTYPSHLVVRQTA
jgi:DNA-binding LacI/PurR family transcriptional regulator